MKFYLPFILLTALSSSAFGQSPKDKELVKGVVLAFQDDFNEGGFKNAETYTTEDWVHINPGGGTTKGRNTVLEEVRAVHQGFLKGVTMSVESMDIRFLNAKVAVVNVVHKMSTYELPPGVKHENERHIKTYILVKKKKQWRLTLDQNTVIAGK